MALQPRFFESERLERAKDSLCKVFGVPNLREHQIKAGENIISGITTLYDIPTGGGKTLAFWLPLFYYWKPGDTSRESEKVVVVISPLNALMGSQAKDLNDRGITAVALNSESGKPEDLFETLPNNQRRIKYRVVLLSPEMAKSSAFHEKVLKNPVFKKSCISVVIDEAHCISEWGTDDFRPDYAEVGVMLARLPSNVPILAASATMPSDITSDILSKLGLSQDVPRIAVSNRKDNVTLSVRLLQQPQSTYADLLYLFPSSPSGPADFPQTLIYVNSRTEAEEIQDFLRQNSPQCIPHTVFEFYHRHVERSRKDTIQEGIANGTYRAVPATDALGMVCNVYVDYSFSE
ncbi:P-loop containing nucleoside triphosphate hydrolase protein [Dendrothele bispora CBS 962.96]|uniref:DNA 3'-5' helicase n=1 Tax=Dendrothele bispora (strain CBS 962.96) TaxID=1314807 RepID=A0A4S8M5L3_DENBC|nr:P-loop containing nucleoside triphosphate hydrolase protein [Dendrothele bispora CBS 962.96]THU99991.1 P-loop containing nucleoside triphosphate hydrolase protein [Dendrothele bispora CBS 962.96]